MSPLRDSRLVALGDIRKLLRDLGEGLLLSFFFVARAALFLECLDLVVDLLDRVVDRIGGDRDGRIIGLQNDVDVAVVHIVRGYGHIAVKCDGSSVDFQRLAGEDECSAW